MVLHLIIGNIVFINVVHGIFNEDNFGKLNDCEEFSWLQYVGQMENNISNLIKSNSLLTKVKTEILPNLTFF